jgi:signal transduction histidine kinase
MSAVVQCADSTVASLSQMTNQLSKLSFPPEIQHVIESVGEEIRNCMDAVETIIACSLHQKRVIDDVLTLSKLDSNLILITPVRVQPVVVVKQAIKMFEVECVRDQISLGFCEDPSLRGLGAEWAMFDPSRLHQVSSLCSCSTLSLTFQVLINLLTNAVSLLNHPWSILIAYLSDQIHSRQTTKENHCHVGGYIRASIRPMDLFWFSRHYHVRRP